MRLYKTTLFKLFIILIWFGGGMSIQAQVTITGQSTICSGNTAVLCADLGFTTYVWSTGESSQCITVNTADTYAVTATDALSNTFTDSHNLAVTTLTLTTTAVDEQSCMGNDGSATVSASGGMVAYTYFWDANAGGQTTSTATNLAPGTYSVDVTDSNGCTETAFVTIGAYQVDLSPVHDTLAAVGDTDGIISVVGAASNYYSWSTGATAVVNYGLAVGCNSVTATDVDGCTGIAIACVYNPIEITGPLVLCSGQTATLCATPGYTAYSWTSGQATQCITISASGSYGVTAEDALGNLSVASQDLVSENISVSATADVSCNGGAGGSATVSHSSTVYTYTYLWSIGATTQTLSNLPAGIYTVTVTSSSGCQEVLTVDIYEPSPVISSIQVNDVSCNGVCDGSAVLNVSGGVAPYTYEWSTGVFFVNNITGLCPDVYGVTVTDANGCTSSNSVTITEPASITVTATVLSDIWCVGGTNGVVISNAAGVIGPHSYLWSSGHSTATATGLSAGLYSVTVSDSNGCVGSTSITLTEPDPIVLTASTTSVSSSGAADGTATVNVTGGIPGYTFLWDIPETTQTITNLAEGCYDVTVTDANGCVAVATACVLPAPTSFSVYSYGVNLNTCNQCLGEVSVLGNGGVVPYTYSWSDGFTGPSRTGLCPATYSVTITDNTGATASESYEVSGTAGCVWPGDENNDQVVNMYDVLSVGLAYGNTGPQRTNNSIIWNGYEATDWGTYHNNGSPVVNDKHVDSDGNGLINDDDTLAISLNYDSIYLRNGSVNGQVPLLIEGLGAYVPGSVLSLPIHLGTPSNIAEDVYGIAFSIIYDPAKVDSGSVSVDFSNCWLDPTGNDLLTFSRDFSTLGRIDVAVSRTNQTNITGYGSIGHLQMTIRDDVFRSNVPFLIDIINARLLDANGDQIGVDEQELVFDINTSVNSVNPIQDVVEVFPNPASHEITLESKEQIIEEVTLYSVSGRLVKSYTNLSDTKLVFDVSSVSNGLYYLSVKTQSGTISKKVAIMH